MGLYRCCAEAPAYLLPGPLLCPVEAAEKLDIQRPSVPFEDAPQACAKIPKPQQLQTFFVLHLFSGQRREGDFQYHLEGLLTANPLPLVVLSLGVASHPVHGDLSRADTIKKWLDIFASGRAIAVVGGPPCETWSAARAGPPGPRPLRSQSLLWGISDLTKTEAVQVQLGNDLLRTMMLFLYMAAASGLAALMEHPARPSWRPSAPSSWLLPEMIHLTTLPDVKMHYVDQCTMGTSYKKPTQLLSVNMPTLLHHIQGKAAGGRCNGLHKHTSLMGRTSTGEFNTAVAKQYPSLLCNILAHAVLDFAASHLSALAGCTGPEELEQDMRPFFVPLDPYFSFVMQHDCAGVKHTPCTS